MQVNDQLEKLLDIESKSENTMERPTEIHDVCVFFL